MSEFNFNERRYNSLLPVSRLEYEEMKKLGYISEKKNNSNRSICNRQKRGKHKTYYVQEDVIEMYRQNK
jgi:hypothetical protein